MKTETIIHSNGSKWAGQENDSIDFLIEMLNKYTIEERFFSFYEETTKEKGKLKIHFSPITKKEKGYNFFGNFEEISHVFRIDTNDEEIIKKLCEAIRKNKGWLKYYEKSLLN